jgi:hypothetical protein
MSIRPTFRRLAQKLGFDLVPYHPGIEHLIPVDLTDEEKGIIRKAYPFTMTGMDRLAAQIAATRHISVNKVPGAIVECGVWRGGSTMAALLTLASLSSKDRDIYLYDTFTGMSEPTEEDRSYAGVAATTLMAQDKRGTGVWCEASLEDVKANVLSTGYPPSKIHFVPGKVEETIPKTLPASIALLRLDTDFYESTRHELDHLFPLLHPRGVLIVDDYGHWAGARKAVDEYFQKRTGDYYFHRIDYTGRAITRIGD